MTTSRWTSADIPDLSGKTAIVTGASSGLGTVTARGLAEAGARVVLAVRSSERGREAAERMDGHPEVRTLDLGDLASIRSFVDDLEGPIDLLINNAGIMAVPERKTVDGFESQFGTNHLGHFLLTTLLLPRIRDRVVTVSSEMARRGEIDMDDLNWESRTYKGWGAYGQSKLANLLFTKELQRRLDESQSPVRALAAHPGVARTQLQTTGNRLQDLAMKPMMFLATDATRGALPTLFAAVSDLPGGTYVGPDGRMGTRRSPLPVDYPPAANDADMARELWQRSVELTSASHGSDT